MEILGLHLDPPYGLAALVRKRGKAIEIRSLKKFNLSEPEHVKQLYNKDFNGWIATGISAKNLLIRSMELKISSKRHLEEAVFFQTDATSHFDPSEMIVLPLLREKNGTTTEATLYTVPKDALKAHLSDLEQLQIDPDGVSAISSAVCCYIHWKIPTVS